LENKLFPELEAIIEKYRGKPGNLIPVLNEVQKKVGYLPLDIQEYISRELHIPLSRIYGVISFYSMFSTTPRGKHTIGVCMGTACYVKGAEEVLNKIKQELEVEIGETSADGKFTLTITRCLGTCSMAPVIMIDEQVYGGVTPAKVPEILASK